MSRLYPPDGKAVQVQTTNGRVYSQDRKGGFNVGSVRDERQLLAIGCFRGTGTLATLPGYVCGDCGFNGFFRKCGKCGGTNTTKENRNGQE